MSAKSHQTQWAAQFLVAAELIRRGYTVSFTTGNTTPVADLMVGADSGALFWVDVKGLSYSNAWLVKPKKPRVHLFYVLVSLSKLATGAASRKADRFFILTQAEINALEESYRLAHPNVKTILPGFNYTDAFPYEDRWDSLPVS